MIQICRAEDGEVFQVNATVRDIERTGSLEFFLHQETGVDEQAILAYLSDGRRLGNENIRELAGAYDQSIFVFNKYYLDFDLDEVLRELRVEPRLQPPVEDNIPATPPIRPSHLAASYLHVAHTHHDHINHTLSTLRYQYEAVRIASSSLDHHVLAIADAFDGIAGGARRELDKQVTLLAGLEADLDIISRVKIHMEFMSPGLRKAIEAGEKPRTLGDYVSNVKMMQVAETCSRTHDDLRSRFAQTEEAVSRLTSETDAVRDSVSKTDLLDEADSCLRRSQDLFNRISSSVASLESSAADSNAILLELKQFDNGLRNELKLGTDTKNAYTKQCIDVLRRISTLNNDLVLLPPTLLNLQTSFRSKNSFSHIQRLHNMLYAYGATVVEIVRRKEFARFFYQRAQSILEVMAKLSASERKRRQVYRGEIHGQLPFDTRGMDDPVPAIDFSPSGSTDSSYSLERDDVDGLLLVLDDLERLSQSNNDVPAIGSVQEARISLEKLISRMDSLESGFDRIAERSLLSTSRLSTSRRRLTEADEQAYHELSQQLRDTQQSKAHQETLFQHEKEALQAELARLKEDFEESVTAERIRADQNERDLSHVRAQAESDATALRILEQRHSDMSSHFDSQREALDRALADAADQTMKFKVLRQELDQSRAKFDEIKELEAKNSKKIDNLLEEQANNLRNLEEARARGENLETQIQAARTECEEVKEALREAGREKDRLLRTQAAEHDRVMRDHIAEADGDRAVLEQRFHELRAVQEDMERRMKDAQSQNEVACVDAAGLREELQRVERELREARHVERVLRDDLKAGRASQSDYEHRLESSGRLIAQILDVAISFRNSHVKALSSAQAMSSHPKQSTVLADSTFSVGMRYNIIGQPDDPSPIDPSDPNSALEALRAFDHDHFMESIAKTGSTIRKWQKQCKEYRERAKGKISFRNFAKGDLALFLPTRNSVSKPWAAFNVSFPHYFLQATGHLAEQLKTREWIVARITSIAERVVDHNDPTSNPYALGDGVKYYMLEVEDWTQPSQQNRRRVSSRKTNVEQEAKDATMPAPNLASVPPEAEVEDSFRVTRPPTSHLFPVRSRSNSSPNAGRSSLSRLLAQAPAENSLETTPASETKTPSPPTSPPPPPSPTHTGSGPQSHVPHVHSPLRPGSRASRMSVSSRYSVGRLPPMGSTSSGSLGSAKAAATTALSEQILSASPTAEGLVMAQPSSPSPDGSMYEGMSNHLLNRRRTTSYHVPRTSPLVINNGIGPGSTKSPGTLAHLANSWGVTFGRKKKTELTNVAASPTAAESSVDASGSSHIANESSARDLLQRF